MKDRGMIKWQPFDSVFSSKKMIQNILIEIKSFFKLVELFCSVSNRITWENSRAECKYYILSGEAI